MTRDVPDLDCGRRPGPVTAGERPAPPLPSSWVCTATWTQRVPRCKPRGRKPASRRTSVPDVLAPGARLRLLRDQPGTRLGRRRRALREPPQRLLAPPARRGLHAAPLRPAGAVLAARARHRRDERRLSHDARLGRPAARRLRRARASRRASATPRRAAVAFVGKEAYRGLFNERPELGPQVRSLGATGLFVLPSTSPANAAVPYDERLRWFRELRAWLEPVDRRAVRALVLDDEGRVLLVSFEHPVAASVVGTPGGGVDPGETDEQALAPRAARGGGLHEFELGPVLSSTRAHLPVGRASCSVR